MNEVKLADIVFYLRFRPSIRLSVCTQFLDANSSKMVWDRNLVPITQ